MDAKIAEECEESFCRVKGFNMEEALSSVNLVPIYKVIRRHKIVMGRNYLHFVHTRTEGFMSFVRTQWCHVIFVL